MLYMKSKKKKIIEVRSRGMVTNGWGMGEMEEILVKGYKLPVIR